MNRKSPLQPGLPGLDTRPRQSNRRTCRQLTTSFLAHGSTAAAAFLAGLVWLAAPGAAAAPYQDAVRNGRISESCKISSKRSGGCRF